MLPQQNLKILFVQESFQTLTGSELYTYTLAKELLSRGHTVHIAADKINDGELIEKIRQKGAVVWATKSRASGYTWIDFDIIHTAQPGPTKWALVHFRQPIVCTIHSPLSMEQPVIDDRIKHYIAVRPEILAKLIVVDEIPVSKLSVIYNPIDAQRFSGIHKGGLGGGEPIILFCGTVDNIRKQTILQLIEQKTKLIIVGDKNHMYDGYIDHLPEWVEWFPSTRNIEEYIAKCTATASVFVGRTVAEGWFSGRPSWVFDIKEDGTVKDFTLQAPPLWLPLFDSKIVTDQVLSVYERIYK